MDYKETPEDRFRLNHTAKEFRLKRLRERLAASIEPAKQKPKRNVWAWLFWIGVLSIILQKMHVI